jgi:hypothetical protein
VQRDGLRFEKQKYVTLFLRSYYRENMTTATCSSGDPKPAFVEFSLLESWLASSSALQLPLHQIESQQQAKGREVQRLLLQAHLHVAEPEIWGLRCESNRQTARPVLAIS